jgi:hypothetical protein
MKKGDQAKGEWGNLIGLTALRGRYAIHKTTEQLAPEVPTECRSAQKVPSTLASLLGLYERTFATPRIRSSVMATSSRRPARFEAPRAQA